MAEGGKKAPSLTPGGWPAASGSLRPSPMSAHQIAVLK